MCESALGTSFLLSNAPGEFTRARSWCLERWGAAVATQSSAGRRHTKRPRCGRARPWRWTPAQAVLTKMEHVLEVKLCGMGVGSSLAPGGGK